MSNHLKNVSSPYLLQHSENPVNRYPWCDEAFDKAKAENKPIFLSIGYSACHWRHVMAHESFENTKTAEISCAAQLAVSYAVCQAEPNLRTDKSGRKNACSNEKRRNIRPDRFWVFAMLYR